MLRTSVDSLVLHEANERGVKGVDLRYLLEKQERTHSHAAAQDAASWVALFEVMQSMPPNGG